MKITRDDQVVSPTRAIFSHGDAASAARKLRVKIPAESRTARCFHQPHGAVLRQIQAIALRRQHISIDDLHSPLHYSAPQMVNIPFA
jgi:hypothetical protein